MSFYENLFKDVLFPFYETNIQKRKTIDYLKEYEKNLELSTEELYELQWKKLKELLQFCIDEIPYYRETWAEIGFTHSDDFKSMDDFYKLPILTKDIIIANQDRLISDKFKEGALSKTTSGSTGKSMRIELSAESEQRRQAVMWRGYSRAGAGIGKKVMYLWGSEVVDRGFLWTLKNNLHNKFFNRKMLNANEMNENNMDYYLNEINKYKAYAIVSFVNPLYELAKFINKGRIKIVHSPEAIITGAEALSDIQKEAIEKAFRCKVYNTFGCREFMLIGSECDEQNGFHTNIDHLVVETINDDGESVKGEMGELIITDLHNYRMPFIRYANGDMAVLSEKNDACSCGSPLPKIKEISGRKLDMLRTPNGKIIQGLMFAHLFKDLIGLCNYQIIQNEIDTFDINFIVNAVYDHESSENQVRKVVDKLSENQITCRFHYVKELEKTAAGKFRQCIYNVK